MQPKILIVTFVKNSAKFLPYYFESMKQLSYPSNKLRLCFIYGESGDKTLDIIKKEKSKLPFKAEIYKEYADKLLSIYGVMSGSILWEDAKNLVKDEEYILFIDSDVEFFPKDLIEQLLVVNSDIVAPYVYIVNSNNFYATWYFRIGNQAFNTTDPPAKDSKDPIELDSVGVCFLIKAGIYQSTKLQNPYPALIICHEAHKYGYKVVACPYIKVYHANLEELGIIHSPLNPEAGLYPTRGLVDSKTQVVTYKIKSIDEIENMINKDSESIVDMILKGSKQPQLDMARVDGYNPKTEGQ
jgi:glycosyltransferase involved in cell wall biosynthesis